MVLSACVCPSSDFFESQHPYPLLRIWVMWFSFKVGEYQSHIVLEWKTTYGDHRIEWRSCLPNCEATRSPQRCHAQLPPSLLNSTLATACTDDDPTHPGLVYSEQTEGEVYLKLLFSAESTVLDTLWQPVEALYPALSSFPLSWWIVDELKAEGVGLCAWVGTGARGVNRLCVCYQCWHTCPAQMGDF